MSKPEDAPAEYIQIIVRRGHAEEEGHHGGDFFRFSDDTSVSQLALNTYYKEKKVDGGTDWEFHFFPFFSFFLLRFSLPARGSISSVVDSSRSMVSKRVFFIAAPRSASRPAGPPAPATAITATSRPPEYVSVVISASSAAPVTRRSARSPRP